MIMSRALSNYKHHTFKEVPVAILICCLALWTGSATASDEGSPTNNSANSLASNNNAKPAGANYAMTPAEQENPNDATDSEITSPYVNNEHSTRSGNYRVHGVPTTRLFSDNRNITTPNEVNALTTTTENNAVAKTGDDNFDTPPIVSREHTAPPDKNKAAAEGMNIDDDTVKTDSQIAKGNNTTEDATTVDSSGVPRNNTDDTHLDTTVASDSLTSENETNVTLHTAGASDRPIPGNDEEESNFDRQTTVDVDSENSTTEIEGDNYIDDDASNERSTENDTVHTSTETEDNNSTSGDASYESGNGNDTVDANTDRSIVNIVGGQAADKGEYPWQIFLLYGQDFICGGTIVDPHTILTAAHCVDPDPKQYFKTYTVVAGDHNVAKKEKSEQRRKVDKVIINPSYSSNSYNNDVAILQLSSALEYDKFVKPVILSDLDSEEACRKKGKCTVTGAGVSQEFPVYQLPKVLQEVTVELLSNKACKKIARKRFDITFTPKMLCSNQMLEGPCNGDSGGPIGCYVDKQFVQIGVVAYGSSLCAEGFNGYSRIYKHLKWISKYI